MAMPARTPKDTVKIRRLLPKRGDERLLRAKVLEVVDQDKPDPVVVLEIDGLMVYAPVRVRDSKTIKPS